MNWKCVYVCVHDSDKDRTHIHKIDPFFRLPK